MASWRPTIVQSNSHDGIQTWSAQRGYNVIHGNGSNALKATELSVDPLLTGPYHELGPGSPAIDAGDPSVAARDSDGSRNDIGATGGPGAEF